MKIIATAHFKGAAFAEQFQERYKVLDLSYPKFHKMDHLSQLMVLCTEPLFRKCSDLSVDPDQVGIVMMSSAGCRLTDEAHWNEVQEHGVASPATFVYTLPNIGIGELSIKHGIHTASMMLIGNDTSSAPLVEACEMIFAQGATHVVCGRADIFADAHSAACTLLASHGSQPDIETELRNSLNA